MRKKLAATVCVFAGVIISASLLIVSVLAATSASATITASVSYTPAIQAKVWLNDGGTYGKSDTEDTAKGMLIFNNVDSKGIHSIASFNNGTISLQNYSALNGTTFTITVDNHSANNQAIYFGLKISASSTAINGSELVTFEDTDPYKLLSQTETIGTIAYKHNNTTIASNGGSQSISFTPEIVIPVQLSFDIALFTEKATST